MPRLATPSFQARGVYPHCNGKHLHRYLAEFDFRYTNRIGSGVDDAIRVIRPYKPVRGRWNGTALELLRKANHPLKAFELERIVMSAQGVAPDRRTLFSIGYSLQAVLARLEAPGLIKATGKPRRWSVS